VACGACAKRHAVRDEQGAADRILTRLPGAMVVMVANSGGNDIGIRAERHKSLGHLYSPGGERGPWPELPYALDNGAWAAAQKNLDFPEDAWRRLLAWAGEKRQPPLWALVPDSVADRDRTLEKWERFSPLVRVAGFRPAFAIQDEMTFADVPDSDCMLFIGGSTSWKMAAIKPWCARFPGRVHVGRVTEAKRLWLCYEAGAVSVDGNKWHMKTAKPGSEPQWYVLVRFLEFQDAQRKAAACSSSPADTRSKLLTDSPPGCPRGTSAAGCTATDTCSLCASPETWPKMECSSSTG